VNDLPTIENIRAKLAQENPRLADDTLDDASWRVWRTAWHQRQIDRLCEASTDPGRVRALLAWVSTDQELRAQLAALKALLLANGLVDRAVLAEIADEPAKMTYPATANKQLYPTEHVK